MGTLNMLKFLIPLVVSVLCTTSATTVSNTNHAIDLDHFDLDFNPTVSTSAVQDRRERNKIAAKKSRQKRKERQEVLASQVDTLTTRNAELSRENQTLKAIVAQLKSKYEPHTAEGTLTQAAYQDSPVCKRPKYSHSRAGLHDSGPLPVSSLAEIGSHDMDAAERKFFDDVLTEKEDSGYTSSDWSESIKSESDSLEDGFADILGKSFGNGSSDDFNLFADSTGEAFGLDSIDIDASLLSE